MVVRYYYGPPRQIAPPKSRRVFRSVLPVRPKKVVEAEEEESNPLQKRRSAALFPAPTPVTPTYLVKPKRSLVVEEEFEDDVRVKRRLPQARAFLKKRVLVVEPEEVEVEPVVKRRAVLPITRFILRARRLADIVDDVEDLLQRKPRPLYGSTPIIIFEGGSIVYDMPNRTLIYEMPRRSTGVEFSKTTPTELPFR